MKFPRLTGSGTFVCLLTVCLQLTATAHAGSVINLEWTDLMPEEDLRLLMEMPAIDHGYYPEDDDFSGNVLEGGQAFPDAPPATGNSLADSVEGAIAQAMADAERQANGERTWMDALVSTRVRPEYNNTKVRLPGFVVPLEFDDDMRISEFFLVPYYGACIHVPPPPPNQIIFVEYAPGLQLDALYTPFWITGTLKTETVENDLALASYSLVADSVVEYTE